jgi:hypothetical protein
VIGAGAADCQGDAGATAVGREDATLIGADRLGGARRTRIAPPYRHHASGGRPPWTNRPPDAIGSGRLDDGCHSCVAVTKQGCCLDGIRQSIDRFVALVELLWRLGAIRRMPDRRIWQERVEVSGWPLRERKGPFELLKENMAFDDW